MTRRKLSLRLLSITRRVLPPLAASIVARVVFLMIGVCLFALGGWAAASLAAAPLSWARAQSAVVEQTTYLFSATLRDNLLLAAPAATDDQLIEALRAAHLGEFYDSLPGGLDARVGARGLAVSGGEAQRIAIARAFLKNASIMILDEPTAHVDLASEREILASLETVCAGRTTLTISHRDATIKGADRVVTLTEGTIR